MNKTSTRKERLSKEQILEILKRHESGGKIPDLARENGVSIATVYAWRNKYASREATDAQRLKTLEEENRVLKYMVADLSLEREVLRSVLSKNGWSPQ